MIWDRAVPPEAVALERRCRASPQRRTSLREIALAPVRRGLAVVLVDTLPRLDAALPARARILGPRRATCRRGHPTAPMVLS
jgi:hypothetical protein